MNLNVLRQNVNIYSMPLPCKVSYLKKQKIHYFFLTIGSLSTSVASSQLWVRTKQQLRSLPKQPAQPRREVSNGYACGHVGYSSICPEFPGKVSLFYPSLLFLLPPPPPFSPPASRSFILAEAWNDLHCGKAQDFFFTPQLFDSFH